MQKKRALLIFAIILVSIATFTATVVHALFFHPDPEALGPEPAVPKLQSAEVSVRDTTPPTRLVIPSIEVDAKVQHVGVNAKGNMATPSNFKDVAWYKNGPSPGENGNAVIAGHLDNGLGLPAVFWRLRELRPGNEISIEAEDGSVQRFVVTDVQSYQYKEVPTALIFNPTGPAGLTLITCDGTWIAREKTYDRRLVVSAVPAE